MISHPRGKLLLSPCLVRSKFNYARLLAQGEASKLGKAEKFMQHMCQVSCLEDTLNVIAARHQFAPDYEVANKNADIITAAALEMKSSTRLTKVPTAAALVSCMCFTSISLPPNHSFSVAAYI